MEEDELREILGVLIDGKGGWAHQLEIAVKKILPSMNACPLYKDYAESCQALKDREKELRGECPHCK